MAFINFCEGIGMNTTKNGRTITGRFLNLCGLSLLGVAGLASAQTAPPSFKASPDIYKIIAEDSAYRVVEVTWKPKQKDVQHSHPAAAVYYLNDCSLRSFAKDGSQVDGFPKKGTARVQSSIPSHAIENIGAADCKLIMFEPK